MLGLMKDFANLLTLAGLFCGLFGIYFAILGMFSAAMISMLFALLFDWFDGPIARRSRGRSLQFGEFGQMLLKGLNIAIALTDPGKSHSRHEHF